MNTHVRSTIPTRRQRPGRDAIARLTVALLVAATIAAPISGSPVAAQDAPGASLTVVPDLGPSGAAIEIAGRGFVDACAVTLSVGPPGTAGEPLADVAVRPDGTFAASSLVPTTAALGPAEVRADARTSTDGDCDAPTEVFGTASFEVLEEHPELAPRFVPDKPTETLFGPYVFHDRAHLKFHEGTRIRLGPDGFEGDAAVLTPLQLALEDLPALEVERLFHTRSEEELAAEKVALERRSGREQADKNLYYLLRFPEEIGEDGQLLGERVVDALNALEFVELASPELLPGDEDPGAHSPDLTGLQGYRRAAPGGIHADAANAVAGGRGEHVQIIDIERFFFDHEDLPDITVYPHGDPDDYTDPFNHGTAVLGQLFGLDNDFGVLGITDQAHPAFVSEGGNRPNAIDIATANSEAGDVILLEIQRGGPNGGCSSASTPVQFGCSPEEILQASYDAIVAAVSAGIIVVAAAGNGRQDLDAPEFEPTIGSRPDSGAIIVGAGGPDPEAGFWDECDPFVPPRARVVREPNGWGSNFGSRVNLQGWGRCVATTGYGGALGGASETSDSYTGGFSGTSSASPIVAGAAGILSSVAQEQGNPLGMSSTLARSILVATGTPQNLGPGAPAGNIGPLPNLAAALGLQADLVVTTSADPSPVVAGTSTTYTVTVANEGPHLATDVLLKETLPTLGTLVSADERCSQDAPPGVDLVCDLGHLAVGTSTEVEVEIAIAHNQVFVQGGPFTITNTASATGTVDDPDPDRATATLDTTVIAEGDLEVIDVEVSGVPDAALIGEDVDVTVTSTLVNNGPSWPMHAELETTATPSAGASVDPSDDTLAVNALSPVPPRVVDQAFTVRCEEPGSQQVTFEVTITPANAADGDPDPTNDTGQAVASLDCVVPIAINVRPANTFNRIHVGSQQVVPVAALTTDAGEYGLPVAFDAATILVDTVRFGASELVWTGTGGAPSHNGITHLRDSFERDDHTKDGDLDLVGGFRTADTGLVSGDSQACMGGLFADGGQQFAFLGCDDIQTIP